MGPFYTWLLDYKSPLLGNHAAELSGPASPWQCCPPHAAAVVEQRAGWSHYDESEFPLLPCNPWADTAQEHLLSGFSMCWTKAVGWLTPRPRKDRVHGDSRKARHHPPALCPRVQGTITQALYGTVGPTVVEVPGSCAFLVKHWPGQAKNSLSWDQCVSRKWCEWVAPPPPPRRASQHSSSQAAWEGRDQDWGGMIGMPEFLSHWPGLPCTPSSVLAFLPLLRAKARLWTPTPAQKAPRDVITNQSKVCLSLWRPLECAGFSHIPSDHPLPQPPCPWGSTQSRLLGVSQTLPCSYLVTLLSCSPLWMLPTCGHSTGPSGTSSSRARSSPCKAIIGFIIHPGLSWNKTPKPELPGQTGLWGHLIQEAFVKRNGSLPFLVPSVLSWYNSWSRSQGATEYRHQCNIQFLPRGLSSLRAALPCATRLPQHPAWPFV